MTLNSVLNNFWRIYNRFKNIHYYLILLIVKYSVTSQTTRSRKSATSTTEPVTTTKYIGTEDRDMSTKTTVSVSLGGSSSVKVSTEANTSEPNVRLKIKSQDGERNHSNNTENDDEVNYSKLEKWLYPGTQIYVF